ncbi:MAG: hypothetical protein AB8E15_10610 [Bdellovibrionales bacterium]
MRFLILSLIFIFGYSPLAYSSIESAKQIAVRGSKNISKTKSKKLAVKQYKKEIERIRSLNRKTRRMEFVFMVQLKMAADAMKNQKITSRNCKTRIDALNEEFVPQNFTGKYPPIQPVVELTNSLCGRLAKR